MQRISLFTSRNRLLEFIRRWRKLRVSVVELPDRASADPKALRGVDKNSYVFRLRFAEQTRRYGYVGRLHEQLVYNVSPLPPSLSAPPTRPACPTSRSSDSL